MRRHELSDEEWAIIQPLLLQKSRGVLRVDDRRVINGILWRFRTGAPWRDVPERYGPRTTLYNRFVRWRAAGVWDRFLDAVSKAYDGDIVMIDSSCVRVHQHGAAVKRGAGDRRRWLHGTFSWRADHEDPRPRRRGGPSRQADPHRRTGGRRARRRALAAPRRARRHADRRPCLRHERHPGRGRRARAWANIPPRVIRKDGFAFSARVYKQRNLIERFFNRIKHFRGLATRYDRSPDNFLAALKLAAIRIWLAAK